MRAVQQFARLGPANRVTLLRLLLAGVVAGLVVADTLGRGSTRLLVGVAAVALVLDAVDGQVARRTGTVSAFGARFDMETDAFLILVLSVHVARTEGWWVLAIGLARYALWVAARVWPVLRRPTPPRVWAKVVAAVQGVVLVVVAGGVLPGWLGRVLLVAGLLLLAESFGHQVCVLAGWSPRSVALNGAALVLVWVALVLPARPGQFGPLAAARVPLEVPLLLGLGVLLPRRPRRVLAVVLGLLLALVVVLKVLDLGFGVVLDRRFDPLGDVGYLGPAIGVLADSTGQGVAVLLTILVGLVVVGLLVVMPLALARLLHVAGRHRVRAVRALVVITALWLVGTVVGLRYPSGLPVAGTGATGYAAAGVAQLQSDLADRRTFAREIRRDAHTGLSPRGARRLLHGLRGKDVLLVFVESYGRRAVEGSPFAPRVRAALDRGTRRLATSGFAARSAYLTSPTFGAASWLAHSTLQSGTWVDSQRRYDQLLRTDRLTLTRAFDLAGWRTVVDVPANTRPWPEGARFYGYDKEYDAHDVGYRGPKLGYATMPDQYTLAAFRRLELEPRPRKPVMAEIDLVSSHHPWTPRFPTVPWSHVGDGSVFGRLPAEGGDSTTVFRDPAAVRSAYADTIVYSIDTLVSFLAHWPDRDLVLVVLGDHQPHSYVTGRHPGHDVPVSVIARDPAVLDRIAGWDWQPGLRPRPDAPVWRMDAFRDRFLAAFGS